MSEPGALAVGGLNVRSAALSIVDSKEQTSVNNDKKLINFEKSKMTNLN